MSARSLQCQRANVSYDTSDLIVTRRGCEIQRCNLFAWWYSKQVLCFVYTSGLNDRTICNYNFFYITNWIMLGNTRSILLAFEYFWLRIYIFLMMIIVMTIIIILPHYYPSEIQAIRREFLSEILYNNIAIIAIQHSKIYFVDTFGDFFHTVEWNSLKSVWQISLYILA